MWNNYSTVDRAAISRCDRCGLRFMACICECIPPSNFGLNITLILHPREFRRPTSTSRFLSLFEDVELISYSRDKSLELPANGVLLFPQDEGKPIADAKKANSRSNLIVVDGTWQECQKMVRQHHQLKSLPRVAVNPTDQSIYPFRRNQRDGGLCTAEAVIAYAGGADVDVVPKSLLEHYFRHAKASQNGHFMSC